MPTQSPQTQHYMQDPHGQDAEALFNQSFTDIAFQQLESKFPELTEQVATFKIIHSDVHAGSAIGAFILVLEQGEIFIPAVVSDNQMKPLEMMYNKTQERFTPLSVEWIDAATAPQSEDMGYPATESTHIDQNMDISALVRPPQSGKNVYASDRSANLKLPEFLAQVPNSARKKFANTLVNNKKLLKIAAAVYGVDTLVQALKPRKKRLEKTASYKDCPLQIVTVYSREQDIVSLGVPHVMQKLASEGYAAKDDRKLLNTAVATETTFHLEEVLSNGVYKFYQVDGKPVIGLAAHPALPVSYARNRKTHDYLTPPRYTGRSGHTTEKHITKRLKDDSYSTADWENPKGNITTAILLEDGRLVTCNEMNNPYHGQKLTTETPKDIDAIINKVMQKGRQPKSKDKGVFVRFKGSTPEITEKISIYKIYSQNGVKRIECTPENEYETITLILDPDFKGNKIVTPFDEKLAYIPNSFVFIPVADEHDECLVAGESKKPKPKPRIVKNPYQLRKSIKASIKEAGATDLTIKKASDGTYIIRSEANGSSVNDRFSALFRLTYGENLSVPAAEGLLKEAAEKGSIYRLNLSPRTKYIFKLAQAGHPAMQGGMPMEGDPAMQGGMPMEGHPHADPYADPHAQEMMPQEPMVDPISQAVEEVGQELETLHEKQVAALELQKANLEKQLQTLALVFGRAQEIQMGVPAEESEALMMVGESVPAPVDTVTDPDMAMQEGMSPMPSEEEQMMMGQDPQMMGQDPQMMGQAPQMMGLAPQMMGQEGMMPAEQQELMGDAGMVDPEMFDTAAISSIAETNQLSDLVGNYLPSLQKSLDHTGRLLLSLWLKAPELKMEMGEEGYENMEEKLRNVFRETGALLIKVKQNQAMVPEAY